MDKNRREFLWAGCLSALTYALSPFTRLFAENHSKPVSIIPASLPDLVAVKDGSPAQMFDIGIAALGGMGHFVKPGQSVLIKPNIGWNKTPNEGANTNPDLVGKIIKHAFQAGAAKVHVFDHTCNEMGACYERSGMKKVVKTEGAVLHSSDKEKYYKKVNIPEAELLKDVSVHKIYLEADVIINVPVLKHHASTEMTSALKNLMGVVWDRRYWHREGLNRCIAEFPLLRKVDLTVIDAYTIMVKNGPRGISQDDLVLRKMQILSPDMVLADTAAAKTLEVEPMDVRYLKLAEELGHGSMALDSKFIKRVSCKTA